MPTQAALALENFMSNYQAYQNAVSFAMQWNSQIISLAQILSSDTNYSTALSSDEQSALQSNLSAAQAAGVSPIVANPVSPAQPVGAV